MKKLIELDAAVSALDGLPMDYGRWDVDDVLHALASVPTVDAVPVVHGRWIETKHGFCCNQCHTRRPLDWDGQMWLSSFCPNCGAIMDGKEDGDNHD